MRPITVSVGPLGAATATFGTFIAGSRVANGPSSAPTGGALSVGAQVTASISTAGLLTITAITSGILAGRQRLVANQPGLWPGTIIVGPAPGSTGNVVGGTWIVYPAPFAALAGAQVRTNPVATLDAPRQLVITNTEVAPLQFTITGTDAAGSPISETLTANGGNLTTQQNFATVTGATSSAPVAATATFGTAATATSQWVNFDPWAMGNISYVCDANGTVNYTVQISNDDPNSPTNPVPPSQMVWPGDPNANMVGATTSQAAAWQFIPLYARILLNSGAGSVTGTFVQALSVPE